MSTSETKRNRMANPRILISGATGFVGKTLLPYLSEDFDIDVLCRKTSDLKELSQYISKRIDWDELEGEEQSYQAIVHMAGLAHDTSSKNLLDKYLEVNLGLTEKVLAFAERMKIKK